MRNVFADPEEQARLMSLVATVTKDAFTRDTGAYLEFPGDQPEVAAGKRDLRAEFERVGARAIGITADSTDRQAEFDRRNSLGLALLSDQDRAVARQFGVKRPGPLFNRRATFAIDTDRRVLAAYSSELNMDTHADRALQTLQARAANT